MTGTSNTLTNAKLMLWKARMGRVESFFATLETELIDRRKFKNQSEAKLAVFDFIEGRYNPRHRHSALGYRSPIRFERDHAEAAIAS